MGSILTTCVRSVNETVDDAQKHVNGEIDRVQNEVSIYADFDSESEGEEEL